MVRFLVAGLLLFAGFITWTVVRSQFDGTGSVTPPATVSAVTPPPPPPPPPPEPTTTTSAVAVDPGKVSHPSKPTPAPVKGPLKPRGKRPPSDGTIEVPDPPGDDDSVAPAP
jgi:hypothetical protein